MSSHGQPVARKVSRSSIRGFDPAAFRAAREDAGMSPGDLVRLAGIRAPLTVRRWEAGESTPQIDVLRRAMTAINAEQKLREIKLTAASEVIRTDPETRFLSDWRHLQLITQAELAERAGLADQAVVARLERGELELAADVAARLATSLDIEVSEVRAAHERARARRPGTPA